ncbi:MAG: 16S rRNA (guanine(527)-N(7))-methyltransferase RsmG [Puniceicoccales bacterium]|jgi:16S rRNA (guanine527-N7)-methyltransferase|nr:16S rRNA (guanine(527)-N(7))-methyltransferase RsmG [Puniceicoccales bacterium]
MAISPNLSPWLIGAVLNSMEEMVRYFGVISTDQMEKLCHYHLLISEWNTKINLVSRGDMENFWTKHIVPSLCINKVVQFAPGSSVIDVGTGGGLPGIPLAITNGAVKFTLVDSIGKKTSAVGDMVKKLALNNVTVKNFRVENLGEKFDYVVARAVSNLPTFLENIGGVCKKETRIFYIRGNDFSDEMEKFGNIRVHNMEKLLGDTSFATKVIVEIYNG